MTLNNVNSEIKSPEKVNKMIYYLNDLESVDLNSALKKSRHSNREVTDERIKITWVLRSIKHKNYMFKLHDIGRLFNCDHATVSYYLKSANDRMSIDKEYIRELEWLSKIFKKIVK